MARRKPTARGWMLLLLAGLCALAALASLCIGAAGIAPARMFEALLGGDRESSAWRILAYVRTPRTLGALLSGAGLAVAGTILQAVLQNPLAGPNIIGINAGAGLCTLLFSLAAPGLALLTPVASFAGALVTTLLICAVAFGAGASRVTIILTGVAVNTMLGAGIDTITTLFPDVVAGANAFLMGGLASVTMRGLVPAGVLILFGLAGGMLLSHELDLLGLGADTAFSLGMRVRLVRFLLIVVAALLAGAAVSFAGLLGFVGLIIPHAARFAVGSENRYLLPASALLGGGFVCVCDLLARSLFAPFELPAGIVMSFIGGPCFLYLLFTGRGRGQKRG